MRFILSMVLLAISLDVFAGDKQPVPETERFLGTWIIESDVDDGKVDGVFKGFRLTFLPGGQVIFQQPDGETARGVYTIEPLRTPKAIDLGIQISDFLIVRKGLYAMEKDVLKICQPDKRNGDRPVKLDAAVGSKCWLWKLRRCCPSQK